MRHVRPILITVYHLLASQSGRAQMRIETGFLKNPQFHIADVQYLKLRDKLKAREH